jgi:hypothetical protein
MVLPSVLPGEVHAYAVVDYNFTWIELLCLYWKLHGDDGLVAKMAVLLNMLDRFTRDRNSAGLILSQPGRRLFLDWALMSRNEPNAVYNLRYLLALQKAAQLSGERQSDLTGTLRENLSGLSKVANPRHRIASSDSRRLLERRLLVR